MREINKKGFTLTKPIIAIAIITVILLITVVIILVVKSKNSAIGESSGLAYYAFGTPTTSSTTDYTEVTYPSSKKQAKVFIKLDPTDNNKSVCIYINNTVECFTNTNPTEEQEHLKQVFGESNCETNGSSVFCDNGDFYCSVNSSNPSAHCYAGSTTRCFIYTTGNTKCFE